MWKKCSLGLDSEFHFFCWNETALIRRGGAASEAACCERTQSGGDQEDFILRINVRRCDAGCSLCSLAFQRKKSKQYQPHQHKSKQMSSDESLFSLVVARGRFILSIQNGPPCGLACRWKAEIFKRTTHASDQSRRVYECLMIIYAHRWDSGRFALWSGLRLLSHRKKYPPAASSTTQEARKRIR